MKRVLVLTKTNWDEAPRIRHQITRMLIANGYAVTFFEKNTYIGALTKNRTEEGIQFYSHAELIHHQLRYFRPIQWANNLVVKFYLRKILKDIQFDFILNFCYDYSFLREFANGRKIITMIEDDFESQAKHGMTKAIRNQVSRTCSNSDCVLTVSYPLMRKLTGYNKNTRMLFPWSEYHYAKPEPGRERNTVLYFGYIHRIDWETVLRLVTESQYSFRFVGPIGRPKDKRMIQMLKKYPNFEYISYSQLTSLKIDDVFCSILPYDPTIKSVQACTISNRGFNLLSLGLPLVYADLNELIEAPQTVIRKNRTVDEYFASLDYLKKNFDLVQNDIETFLNDHYQANRWETLRTVIEN